MPNTKQLPSLVKICILLVCSISIVVFSLLAFFNIWNQRSAGLESVTTSTQMEAELISDIIEAPMTRGDDAGTTAAVQKISKQYTDIALYLTSFNGNITYSHDHGTARKPVTNQFTSPEVQNLLHKALKQDIQTGILAKKGSLDKFVYVSSVRNDALCYHCHGSSKDILGALVVSKDITPIMANIRQVVVLNIVFSVLGLAIFVLCLLYFLRRTVFTPLRAIASVSEEVAKKNYGVTFPPQKTANLQKLSDSLTTMVESLKIELGFSKGLMHGLGLPCVITDTQDRITFINNEALALYGKPQPTSQYVGVLRGQALFNDPERITNTKRVLMSGKDVTGQPYSFITPDKKEHHALVSATRLFDLEGNLLGAFTLMADVTDSVIQRRIIEQQSESMAQVASAARDVSGNVSTAAAQLNAHVEGTNRVAQEQCVTLSNSAASMTQMSQSAQGIQERATATTQHALETQAEARAGVDKMQELIKTLQGVILQTNALVTEMSNLSKQATDINEVVTLIEGIADQTNLLALNAAIEAARAGDVGRGFAVVADEVRKLAEQTIHATAQVSDAVTTIQKSVDESNRATLSAVEALDSSSAQAQSSGETLEHIHTLATKTAHEMQAIAQESNEQTSVSATVAAAVSRMSTQANGAAEAMSNSANAVAELTRLAHQLDEIMDKMQKA